MIVAGGSFYRRKNPNSQYNEKLINTNTYIGHTLCILWTKYNNQ